MFLRPERVLLVHKYHVPMPSCMVMSYNAGKSLSTQPTALYWYIPSILMLRNSSLRFFQTHPLVRHIDKFAARIYEDRVLPSCILRILDSAPQRSALLRRTIDPPLFTTLVLSWESCWGAGIPNPHPASLRAAVGTC